ncbi:MAG: GGDEF domain-containing protein [bacterium]|nr:GGDEF domain-containing protein [bacterium]
MSIKLKITLFILIIITVSLGLTILFLSNKEYKPALKKEIMDRIIINLESYDREAGDYLKGLSDTDRIYPVFSRYFNMHREVMYLKIVGSRKYIVYKKNMLVLTWNGTTYNTFRNDIKVVDKKVPFPSRQSFTNTKSIRMGLYVSDDLRQEMIRCGQELSGLTNFLSSQLLLVNRIMSSNRVFQSIKERMKRSSRQRSWARQAGVLLRPAGRKWDQYHEVIKRSLDLFDKRTDDLLRRFTGTSSGQDLKVLYKQNREISRRLKDMESSLTRIKNAWALVKGADMNKAGAQLASLKDESGRIVRDLGRILEQTDDFREIKIFFDRNEIKGREPVEELDLIRLYKDIRWYDKRIGYYEIGISEDAIMKKITPIIIQGVRSSVVIVLISVILGLFLSLYIIYPIHRLGKDADNILRDVQYRIRVKRKDEFGKFQTAFNHLADRITTELAKYEDLYNEATQDELTKLMVRRYFMSILSTEMGNAAHDKRPTSLLMTDIDHFKKFNDTYGHQTGDAVLALTAGVLLKNVRKRSILRDIVGRYGGEEFCMLLPDTGKEEALKIAERIRKKVEEARHTLKDGTELKVTISIGISTSKDSDTNPEEMISRADKALYQSKESGRNRVSYG